MEENSFQVALRSALSELKDGSMVELSERDPGFRQSEMEEHLAEQDWLKISHEIPQELRDVTDALSALSASMPATRSIRPILPVCVT